MANLARWYMHILDVDHLLQAIDLQQEYQLSFWDAMIVHNAARLGCTRLFSEDLTRGQMFGEVQVINPFRER